MQEKKFRTDINGLRAIAVLAVVFFHFKPSLIPGGFAGVDVFFVISGFLMTSIIVKGLNNKSFSLIKFYLSRARRIFPALSVMILAVLFLCWFFLPTPDYKLLGKHVFSSLLFYSNYIYFSESGYFEASSYDKWLLHTWSLSVEWQFYLILPIILLFLSKFNLIKILFIPITILFFLYSCLLINKSPSLAYYSLISRSWEMMMGGIVFLFPFNFKRKINIILFLSGLSLIILSFFIYSSKTLWPGYQALVPVFGASFVLVSSIQNGFILSSGFIQRIGKWSYSIYLWHWPIFIFGQYLVINNWWYFGIPLSIFMGYLSYIIIENNKHKKYIFLYFPCLILSILVYKNLFSFNELRYVIQTPKTEYLEKYKFTNYYNDEMRARYGENCNFFDDIHSAIKNDISDSCNSKSYGKGILLWGDSHVQAISYGLKKSLPDTPISQVASSACIPSLDKNKNTLEVIKSACDTSNKKAIDLAISLNPKVILFAQQKEHEDNDYLKIINYLKSQGVTSKFILIGPVPQWHPSLPIVIAKSHFDSNEKYILDKSFDYKLFETDNIIKNKYEKTDIKVISILDVLCANNTCLAKVDNENTPLVWDYGHLSLSGSIYVSQHILVPIIKGML
ncbi:acyltransferase family protein [Proteus penneri]|uniref:acyltransferase family protein n=1 Tax=Proteus penneri TaxID=102862 RepID=UPI003C2E3235